MRRSMYLWLILCLSGCSSAPKPQVVIETSMGTIKIELFERQSPLTVKNFLGYVDDKFYDGTIFHYVVEDAVIQGGGLLPDMSEKKTRSPIRNESANGLSNLRGTIAMARTDEEHSITSQFFINVKNNLELDRARANFGMPVFGRVVEGMDVVEKIHRVLVGFRGPRSQVPQQDIVIQSIRRVEPPKDTK